MIEKVEKKETLNQIAEKEQYKKKGSNVKQKWCKSDGI